MLFFGGFVIVICVLAIMRAYAEVDADHVHEWAVAHGLTLTTANRPLVWWYLRNARVLRTWGVVAGVALPPLATAALGVQQGELSGGWLYIFGGHLTGTLYAEASLRRPSPSGTRVASLERRELKQYLPARLRFAPVALALFAASIVVAAASTGELSSSTRADAVGLLAVAVVVAAAVFASQRWIVRRRQPFVEVELVEADDAIRSQSVHSLAGSGSAMVLSLLSVVCWRVGVDVEGPFSGALNLIGFVAAPFSLVACLYYGNRAWRVRRIPLLRSTVHAP